jgi:class 3 adenylate cyclase
MALDFLDRERTLDALVTQRTQALQERNTELERLSARLSKYLSPQLYGTLFKNKTVASISAKRKKLTIFFSDVVGFSEMAERLESEDITRMLNDFLNEMANLALAYGATIDKYIGDAVMIFFGDPETRGVKEDAVACILMALDMQAMTRQLERRWREQGLDQRFQIRIGVNTGYCTVGDFGSQERMDYTIVGHQVNVAARLEQSAAPGAILISHETMTLVSDAIEVEEQSPLHVKGVSGPIRTYKAIGKKTPSMTEAIHEEREGLRVDVDLLKANKDEAISLLKATIERIRSSE